jgi:hypothetical protein
MTTDSYVIAPLDTGNTGKKIRTKTRTVSAQEVHEHVVSVVDGRDLLGIYSFDSGLLTLQAAAHASDVGFIYLINPVGSGVNIGLRRVAYQSAPTSTAARPTSRVTVERFGFTGTHSGAIIQTGKAALSNPTSTLRCATNSTGITITPSGASQKGFLVPAVPNGNNSSGTSNELVWEPLTTDGETIITSGEGIIIRQADAGNSGEDRMFLVNVVWAEY